MPLTNSEVDKWVQEFPNLRRMSDQERSSYIRMRAGSNSRDIEKLYDNFVRYPKGNIQNPVSLGGFPRSVVDPGGVDIVQDPPEDTTALSTKIHNFFGRGGGSDSKPKSGPTGPTIGSLLFGMKDPAPAEATPRPYQGLSPEQRAMALQQLALRGGRAFNPDIGNGNFSPVTGGGISTALGPAPTLEQPPSQEIAPAPDFSPVEEAIARSKPEPMDPKQVEELRRAAILQGLAGGVLNAPDNAGVGELLLRAGLGGLLGESKARTEQVQREQDFDRELREYELARAEAQLNIRQAEHGYKTKEQQLRYQNHLAQMEFRLKQAQQLSPKILSTEGGMIVYSVVNPQTGQMEIKQESSALLERMLLVQSMKNAYGGDKNIDPTMLDYLTGEVAMSQSGSPIAAFSQITAELVRDPAFLSQVFSSEQMELAQEYADDLTARMPAGIDMDIRSKQAALGMTSFYTNLLMQDPRLLDRALQVLQLTE